MNHMPVSKFKASCLELIARVARSGEPLVISKRGKPIADLIPHQRRVRAKGGFGCLADTLISMGDIVAPAVDEEEWEALQ